MRGNRRSKRVPCEKCPPGTYRYNSCGDSTVCQPCGDKEFNPLWSTSTKCQQCRDFCEIQKQEIVRKCTATRDTECDCPAGFYLPSPSAKACVKHTSCPESEGVSLKGTNTTNVECKACEKGFYSDTDSSTEPCIKWSQCTEGQDVIQSGSSKTDVTCAQNNSLAIGLGIGIPILIIVLVIVAVVLLRKYQRCRWSSEPPHLNEPTVDYQTRPTAPEHETPEKENLLTCGYQKKDPDMEGRQASLFIDNHQREPDRPVSDYNEDYDTGENEDGDPNESEDGDLLPDGIGLDPGDILCTSAAEDRFAFRSPYSYSRSNKSQSCCSDTNNANDLNKMASSRMTASVTTDLSINDLNIVDNLA